MNNFCPTTGSPQEWNEAYYRLADYLRAHLFTDKIHQSQVILRILQRAAARHAANPSQSPVTVAMEEAKGEIEQWFRLLLAGREISSERTAVTGRLALVLTDAPAKWPNVFLEMQEIPDELIHAMQQATLQAGPELQVSSMVPRPLDEVEEELPEIKKERIAGFVLAAVCFVLLLSMAFIFF